MATKRVLSVGQCGFDHGRIAHALQHHCDAELVAADTAEEALNSLRRGKFDLILVNRILDGDGSSGLDLIQQVQADDALSRVPVMLVSNLEEAQREATQAGAIPGFGKAALDHPQTLARLKAALSRSRKKPRPSGQG